MNEMNKRFGKERTKGWIETAKQGTRNSSSSSVQFARFSGPKEQQCRKPEVKFVSLFALVFFVEISVWTTNVLNGQ